MDPGHDILEHLLKLIFFPGAAPGILAHFQARDSNAAGIGSLARRVEDFGCLEDMHTFKVGRHVGTFRYRLAAIGHQRAGVIAKKFVLGGAGQGDVAGHVPRGLALDESCTLVVFNIFLDAAALHVLEAFDEFDLFLIDAIGVVNIATRV